MDWTAELVWDGVVAVWSFFPPRSKSLSVSTSFKALPALPLHPHAWARVIYRFSRLTDVVPDVVYGPAPRPFGAPAI